MGYKIIILGVLVSLAVFANGQLATTKLLCEKLEARSDHREVIDIISNKIKQEQLPVADILALQTVIVHKLIALQKWDTCIAYCQQQISKAHKNNSPEAEARFYMLLGNTYYNILKKDKSLEYWLKAIEISEKNNTGETLEHCMHNVGVYYLENNDKENAERYLLRSIDISRKNNTLRSNGGNLHMRLLATLYSQQKKYGQSEDLYKQVIATCRAISDSDNLKEALSFYSETLKQQKKYDKALEASRESVVIDSIRKKQDITLTTLRMHAYNLYAAGKYKDAYNIMLRINDSSQRMYQFDVTSKMSEAEAKFRNNETQHDKDLAILKATKEKQLYLMAFLGLLGTTGYVIYSYYRRKNLKQKLQMSRQVQDEKERLSRDLHDSLGSQMALLSNHVETLNANYSKNLGIEEDISKVKESSKELLQTLRGTIWILNKDEVSAQDFFDKMVDYAHRYLQASQKIKLEIVEEFGEEKMLNGNAVLQLYRICQEAITNAVKYAQSNVLILSGVVHNGKFILSIEDKGIGFDSNNISGDEHFGLSNMRRRATDIGAEISIDSVSGKGTKILIELK